MGRGLRVDFRSRRVIEREAFENTVPLRSDRIGLAEALSPLEATVLKEAGIGNGIGYRVYFPTSDLLSKEEKAGAAKSLMERGMLHEISEASFKLTKRGLAVLGARYGLEEQLAKIARQAHRKAR